MDQAQPSAVESALAEAHHVPGDEAMPGSLRRRVALRWRDGPGPRTFGASGSFGSNIPYIALAVVIWGFVWGLVLRVTAPEVHAKIGRLVFNE
jgi:hypothetical protein